MELLTNYVVELNAHRMQMDKEVLAKLGREHEPIINGSEPNDMKVAEMCQTLQESKLNPHQLNLVCLEMLRQVREHSARVLSRFKELKLLDEEFPDVPALPQI